MEDQRLLLCITDPELLRILKQERARTENVALVDKVMITWLVDQLQTLLLQMYITVT